MKIPADIDKFGQQFSRHQGALAKLGRAPVQRDTAPTFKLFEGLGRPLSPTDKRQDQQAAAMLVSQLFVGPLLAEMRQFPLGGEIGHGGRGEEVFGEQLDQILADRIAARMPGLTGQLRSQFAAQRESQQRAQEMRDAARDQAITSWDAPQTTTGKQLEVQA